MLVEPDADVELAVDRLTFGAFAFAGQVCISTQRILVAEPVADEFLAGFVPRVGRCGRATRSTSAPSLAPMISAARSRAWPTGCARRTTAAPTVLPAVAATAPSTRRPCSTACRTTRAAGGTRSSARSSASTATRASTRASGSRTATRYGLQAAIFTRDLDAAMRAFGSIDAGSIIVNESPFYRAVQQPYGGARDSGFGREGVTFAMEEMTEPRLLVLPVPPAL